MDAERGFISRMTFTPNKSEFEKLAGEIFLGKNKRTGTLGDEAG